ncbi:hypothetical protein ACQ7C1_25620 [Rhizobium sp. Nf11,1]
MWRAEVEREWTAGEFRNGFNLVVGMGIFSHGATGARRLDQASRLPSTERAEKAIIAVFGIRGLSSICYLAFATQRAKFDQVESLWATVFMTSLISVVAHGIAVTPLMRWIDRERGVDRTRPMQGRGERMVTTQNARDQRPETRIAPTSPNVR